MSTSFSGSENGIQSTLPIPDTSADSDTFWRYAEEGMDHVCFGDRVLLSRWMALYTVVYRYMVSITEKEGIKDPQKNANAFSIYDRLKAYLVRHIVGLRESAEIQDKSGIVLLQHYANEWNTFTTVVNKMIRLFSHIDSWIYRQRQEGRKDVYPVNKMASLVWKEHFVDPIQGEDMTLTNTLLTLIEDQRNGESIDQELVRKVANSLSALGIDEENSKKNSLAVYKQQLEGPYMVATSKYFTTTLEASITEGGAIAFLEKARKVFVAEEERTIIFIRAFGRNKFIENCARDVLQDEQIWTGFHKAFGDAEEEDVQRIHAIMESLPYVLEPVRKKIEKLYF